MENEQVTQDVSLDTTPAVPSVPEPEPRPEGLPEEAAATPAIEPEVKPYTDEELQQLLAEDGDIDRKRLTPAQEVIRRSFEKGYTAKFQEAAALRKEAETILEAAKTEPKTYFDDPNVNKYFNDYLENPNKIRREISAQIQRLKAVPMYNEDGTFNPEYTKAQVDAAWWESTRIDFMDTKQAVLEERQKEAELQKELGVSRTILNAYGKTLGFKAGDLDKPELMKAVKKLYDVAHAADTIKTKEVKPTPPKLASSVGKGPERGSEDDRYFDPNISTEERIAMSKRRKGQT